MSYGGSTLKTVKQNLSLLNSRKKHKFKEHFSNGIFSKNKKPKYKFKQVSPEELEILKSEIRADIKSRKIKLWILSIIFTIISVTAIYYFFAISAS